MPRGSSPIIPLGCDPAGLKYLNKAPFHCSYGFPLFLQVVSLRLNMICNNHFNHALRTPVRVRRTDGTLFRDWNHVRESSRIAIHGGRRGEDDVGHIVSAHAAQERDRASNVDAVVLERLLTRFTYSLRLTMINTESLISCLKMHTFNAAKWMTLSIFSCAAKTLSNASSFVTSTL